MMTANEHTHIVSVIVEDHPGVLQRVTGLFTRRGFNIDAISAGRTKDPGCKRLTILVHADEQIVEQIEKQLRKMVDTLKVFTITPKHHLVREMALIKIKADAQYRQEALHIFHSLNARILDANSEGFIVEVAGNRHKINDFIELIPKERILEIVRSGLVAINK